MESTLEKQLESYWELHEEWEREINFIEQDRLRAQATRRAEELKDWCIRMESALNEGWLTEAKKDSDNILKFLK